MNHHPDSDHAEIFKYDRNVLRDRAVAVGGDVFYNLYLGIMQARVDVGLGEGDEISKYEI